MNHPLYTVKDWDTHYENSRSRAVENLRWVSLPNKHDGEGYGLTMEQDDAAELFAAWVLIIQVASKCQVRGTLTRDDGSPLTARSLAMKTRAPEAWFTKALKFFTEKTLWLECQLPDSEPSPVHHPPITQPSPIHQVSADRREGDWIGLNGSELKEKPARLSSETYDESTPTVHPEEGGQAGNPEFSQKDSKAPMTEAAWLNLARKMQVDESFAVALYAEMEAKEWVGNDGAPIAFPSRFLRDAWQRESVRTAERGSKPADGKREPWMIEADIKRAKAEIQRIQSDKANRNHGGHGPNLADHKAEFEDAWLADLRKLRDAVKRELPAEWAKFEREHAEHVAAMIADKVPAEAMGEDYMLGRLSEAMPEEVPSFERWDREWNKANAWKDPEKLTSEARTMVSQLKAHVERLEGELRGVMVAV